VFLYVPIVLDPVNGIALFVGIVLSQNWMLGRSNHNKIMHCNIMQCGNVMLLAAVVATMVTSERYTGADFEKEDVDGPQSN
jgi:hypothetical protein